MEFVEFVHLLAGSTLTASSLEAAGSGWNSSELSASWQIVAEFISFLTVQDLGGIRRRCQDCQHPDKIGAQVLGLLMVQDLDGVWMQASKVVEVVKSIY